MKKFKSIPIGIGFDEDSIALPYRQEAQDLYMLLEQYHPDFQEIENEKINEPNEDLIKNLVSSLNSLNELEFIIALKKIQKLEKFYPITINFGKDLSEYYKNFTRVITALKDSSSFAVIVKMLEKHIHNKTLNDFLEKIGNNDFDTPSDDFVSYINGFNTLLKHFRYDTNKLWEHMKHYRRGKYILNYDKSFDYLNWHIDEDLFGELKDKRTATRVVNVDIFDFNIAKKLSTIQIIINLQLAENEHTQDAYQIDFTPASIEYRFIKSGWVAFFGKALVDDFTMNSKTYKTAEMTERVSKLLEGDVNTLEDIIEFQKYLISLHNKFYRKEIYKKSCQHKVNSHAKPCGREFLTYDKRAPFCYECSNKPNLGAQRTRIHRERKARV